MNYNWDWGIFLEPSITGEGTYLDWMVSGLGWTVALSLSAWTIALLLGSVLGVIRTLPNSRILKPLTGLYVEFFRNIPLLVQLFIWYYVVPQLLPLSWQTVINEMSPTASQFLAATLCLGLFTSARVCEQVRAGIDSQPHSRRQATMALGLSTGQSYLYVLLPIAGRIIIPPLTSEFLNVFKNSAVALTIGLLELTQQSRQVGEFTAHFFESLIVATVLYLLITAVVLLAMRAIEARTRFPGYIGGGA